MSRIEINVAEALRISPGDRILITMDADTDNAEIQEVLEVLRDRFPRCEFTLLRGARVIRMEATE